eukprot:TRINITY_DN2784_c0_g2_i1.p1 TRINITY_DN2784_c0_g2~~TRINITY_DN2784_c0_g2_i1.p1  ORF type:complete len:333 (+),score=107.75 TRINITY_DN2784_c0_g2_i1:108-1001(+)
MQESSNLGIDLSSLSLYVAIFVGVFTTTGFIKYLLTKEPQNQSSSLNISTKNEEIRKENTENPSSSTTTKKSFTVSQPKPRDTSTSEEKPSIKVANEGDSIKSVTQNPSISIQNSNSINSSSISSSVSPPDSSKIEQVSEFKMPAAPIKRTNPTIKKPTVTIDAPKSSPNEPQTGTATMLSTNKFQKRNKVALEPGHSPLDWAKLTMSGKDLSGTGGRLLRVTPEELAKHNKKDDLWMMIRGKVYNCTAYVKFHPGGVPELMRAAGKDGTTLFDEKHAWVNPDATLRGCLVGFWVPE